MPDLTHAESPSFRQVADGLLRLHRLIGGGREESAEADAVRDDLDSPLSALSATEKRRAQMLSEDLYSVTEPPGGPALEPNPQATAGLEAAEEAARRGDWDRALDHLRRWRRHLPPAALAYRRGLAWRGLGEDAVAAAFFGLAADLDPGSGSYRALYLGCLARSDPAAAAAQADRILADPAGSPQRLVVQAADVAVAGVRRAGAAGGGSAYRLVVDALVPRLGVIRDEEPRSVYLLATLLLGASHDKLGEARAAYDAYSLGLRADPDSAPLLVARGILTYGGSPAAVADMERAAELGTDLVWPFFFLAHTYATQGRPDEARRACERGLERKASGAVRSRLHEWLAIAQADLGHPAAAAQANFEAAIRADPSNDMARDNLARFLDAAARHAAPGWVKQTARAVRAVGRAEAHLRLAA